MCATLSPNSRMNITYYGKGKARATPDSLSEFCYDQHVIDTGTHKSEYHLADVS